MFRVIKVENNIITLKNDDGSIHKISSVLFENKNIKEGKEYKILSKDNEEEENRKNLALGLILGKKQKF